MSGHWAARRSRVDLHLWVRELTRIDRVASSAVRYLWSDDGALTDTGPASRVGTAHAFPGALLPALRPVRLGRRPRPGGLEP